MMRINVFGKLCSNARVNIFSTPPKIVFQLQCSVKYWDEAGNERLGINRVDCSMNCSDLIQYLKAGQSVFAKGIIDCPEDYILTNTATRPLSMKIYSLKIYTQAFAEDTTWIVSNEYYDADWKGLPDIFQPEFYKSYNEYFYTYANAVKDHKKYTIEYDDLVMSGNPLLNNKKEERLRYLIEQIGKCERIIFNYPSLMYSIEIVGTPEDMKGKSVLYDNPFLGEEERLYAIEVNNDLHENNVEE